MPLLILSLLIMFLCCLVPFSTSSLHVIGWVPCPSHPLLLFHCYRACDLWGQLQFPPLSPKAGRLAPSPCCQLLLQISSFFFAMKDLNTHRGNSKQAGEPASRNQLPLCGPTASAVQNLRTTALDHIVSSSTDSFLLGLKQCLPLSPYLHLLDSRYWKSWCSSSIPESRWSVFSYKSDASVTVNQEAGGLRQQAAWTSCLEIPSAPCWC